MMAAATPTPWPLAGKHVYGDHESYRRIATWLAPCSTVADWGGGMGRLRKWLPQTTKYVLIDGTSQARRQVLVDLRHYHGLSSGLALRHVLDATDGWELVLGNALAAFQYRAAIVTWTPDAERTHVVRTADGWAVRWFNPEDLRERCAPYLVKEERLIQRHPERIYYLEKAA